MEYGDGTLDPEQLVKNLSVHVTDLLVNDGDMQNVAYTLADAEMKNVYGPAWSINEASEKMDPSENAYWGIVAAVQNKAVLLALANMRHFSNR